MINVFQKYTMNDSKSLDLQISKYKYNMECTNYKDNKCIVICVNEMVRY